MANILVYVSGRYIISPQEEECKCGKVSAWRIIIVSGFTIMGWH